MSSKDIIGIVGAGTMGAGIAQVAATAGHEVLLTDASSEALIEARDNLIRILNRQVEKQRMTDPEAKAILGRISFVDGMTGMREAGLIIEAIVERLDVKQTVFRALEALVAPDCVLATNTSSLSVTSIAGACAHPQRVLGIHFFNPAPLMRLVEIVPAAQSDPDTVSNARQLIDDWGKTTVLAKDTPGFIVNRVARPYYSEALRILEEGLADVPTIDWALTGIGGFKMGPFTLMDYIGNDVNYAVTESVWKACYYEPRYKPAFTQKRLVEAGYLGRKSGRGYYHYGDQAVNPEARRDDALGQQIVERVVVMLINEAADALYWGVASKEDIDLAMTRGVNYPKGLFAWADELGVQHVVDTLDRCFAWYHEERYRCSPLLREMARDRAQFYPR
ncbi:MAG: 3-hydroxyacyl-CoA dehydrogenase NAD-binding domain-containing protein [Saprospiraceae bacterium]|nr:3-hydroxyacyl-CoA dehydrogenase NAD-binding domain-containing protein [Saprospiraceae bacterium]